MSLYTNGPFTDLCRGPHAPSTKRIKAFKLQSVAGSYWRGDASPADAHARVWDGVLLRQGPPGVPGAARARPGQRPPPARPPARPVPVLRGLAGVRVLVPRRHRGVQLAGRAQPRDGQRARLHRGQDPADLRQLAVEDVRSLGQVRRAHVHDRVGGQADGDQADELPRSLPAVLAAPALLPGSAGPLLGAGAAAPPRAERHAARAAAHPPLRPGRQPHLLHRGPDPGRGGRRAGLRLRHLRGVRARRPAGALHPSGEADRLRRAVGPQRAGAGERRWRARASTTTCNQATAPSTGPRSTCT